MTRKIYCIIFLLFQPLLLSGNWLMISGKYDSEWRVEVISEVKSKKKGLYILLDYFEPADYSNIFNSQQIFPLTKNFKGSKYKVTNMTSYENQLRRVFFRMQKNNFFMNKSYKIKTSLNLENFFIHSNYPLKIKSKHLHYYLKNKKSLVLIKKKVLGLIKNKKKTVDVIIELYNWIKNSIQLMIDDKKYSIQNILKYKKANIQGMIDLWVYSLRIAKIPTRVIHGYSLPANIKVELGGKQITSVYPRGYYHWLEIFVPGTGWLPIDPFANNLFFIPENLIRKTTSTYFKHNQDRVFIYPKKPKKIDVNFNIFSEKERDERKLKLETGLPNTDYVFSPPFSSSVKPKKNSNFILNFMPKLVGLYNNPLKIDMGVTTKEALTQKIHFNSKKNVHSVTLPLYFLEFLRNGYIWVELESNGKKYNSKRVNTRYKKVDLKYRFVEFKFPKNLNLIGDVTITLKVKNLAAIFWYGIIGNHIGNKNDSYRKKGHYIHLDLCYKIN